MKKTTVLPYRSEQLRQLLLDIPNYREWWVHNSGLSLSRASSAGGTGVTEENECTFTLRCQWAGWHRRETITFASDGAGVRVTLDIEAEPVSFWMKLMRPLVDAEKLHAMRADAVFKAMGRVLGKRMAKAA